MYRSEGSVSSPPARARAVGRKSVKSKRPSLACSLSIIPGHVSSPGTRTPPSQVRALRAAEGRVGSVGPRLHVRAVVGGEKDEGALGLSRLFQDAPEPTHDVVELEDGVLVGMASR